MKAQSSLAVRRILCRLIPGSLLLLLCGYAFAQKLPESGQGPSVAPSSILGNADDYAGIDRCRSCHKPECREYEKTAHARVSCEKWNSLWVASCQGTSSRACPARSRTVLIRCFQRFVILSAA